MKKKLRLELARLQTKMNFGNKKYKQDLRPATVLLRRRKQTPSNTTDRQTPVQQPHEKMAARGEEKTAAQSGLESVKSLAAAERRNDASKQVKNVFESTQEKYPFLKMVAMRAKGKEMTLESFQ